MKYCFYQLVTVYMHWCISNISVLLFFPLNNEILTCTIPSCFHLWKKLKLYFKWFHATGQEIAEPNAWKISSPLTLKTLKLIPSITNKINILLQTEKKSSFVFLFCTRNLEQIAHNHNQDQFIALERFILLEILCFERGTWHLLSMKKFLNKLTTQSAQQSRAHFTSVVFMVW